MSDCLGHVVPPASRAVLGVGSELKCGEFV